MTTSSPSIDPHQSEATSVPDEHLFNTTPKTAAASNCASSLKVSHNADSDTTTTDVHASTGDALKDDENAKDLIKALLKEKLDEWTHVVQRTGPLRLLDLPVDVLKEIVKEASILEYIHSILS